MKSRLLHSTFNFILSRIYSSTPLWRISLTRSINMATATKIQLTPENVGIASFGKQSKEAAEKTSELLQLNHKVSPYIPQYRQS